MDDLTQRYVDWLNDPEVNQFLETRLSIQTLENVRQYWIDVSNDQSSYWFAICDNKGLHIGNIKVGDICWPHKRGEISLFIGDKSYWGKGYAGEAIQALTQWVFEELKLHKLTAWIYEHNAASKAVLNVVDIQ